MRITNTIFLLLAIHVGLRAQNSNTIFLSQGKIEFEKKVNNYADLKDDNTWDELTKKTMSKFKLSYFDLLFTRNKSLFKPGREVADDKGPGWMTQPAEDNIVYSELDNEKCVSQKKVFEQLFLVQDSLRTIRWKLTDETRTIAGFSCRRANAIIMDSIYVVAFYTDEILTTGGPESFNGLPGMILGVALPHQHVSWFATKVQAISVSDAEVIAPQKGKKVNNASLKETLVELAKNWGGDFGKRYTIMTML